MQNKRLVVDGPDYDYEVISDSQQSKFSWDVRVKNFTGKLEVFEMEEKGRNILRATLEYGQVHVFQN